MRKWIGFTILMLSIIDLTSCANNMSTEKNGEIDLTDEIIAHRLDCRICYGASQTIVDENGALAILKCCDDYDTQEITYSGKIVQMTDSDYLTILGENGKLYTQCTSDIDKLSEVSSLSGIMLNKSMETILNINKEHPFSCMSEGFPSYDFLALLDDGRIVGVNQSSYDSVVYYQLGKESKDVFVYISGSYALTKQGNVYAINQEKQTLSLLEDWSDICLIDGDRSCTGGCIGIKKDGTVLYTGDEGWGRGDVSQWNNIIDVELERSWCVGLKKNGNVVIAGEPRWDEAQTKKIEEWTDVAYISSSEFGGLMAMKKDGTIMVVENK